MDSGEITYLTAEVARLSAENEVLSAENEALRAELRTAKCPFEHEGDWCECGWSKSND